MRYKQIFSNPNFFYLFVFLLSCLVLTGWANDLPYLKSILSDYVSMKANTAIGLMLLAVGGATIQQVPVSTSRRIIASFLASLTSLIALLTLLEYIFDLNLGIDEIFFKDSDLVGTRWPPGRLAPITALSFLFLAEAIILDQTRSEVLAKVRQSLILITWIVSFQALVGYFSGVTYSFGSAFYTQIAIHTSVGFIFLSLGLLFSRPKEGFMAVLQSEGIAGHTVRRLLASAIFIPPLTNYFQLQGAKVGLWNADFGVLLRVVGNVIFFSWVALLTGAKLRAAEIARAKFEAVLEQAVKARDDLLSICSHELKTPIASMKLVIQTVKRQISKGDPNGLSPERIRKLIDQSDRQLDRLIRLIEEMFEFSTIVAGKFSMVPQYISLAEVVEDVVNRLKPQMLEAHCELDLILDRPLMGNWDLLRIEQVVTNLVTNSIKYGAGKAISISLKDAQDKVLLSIRDGGEGVSMDNQNRIFEPYERVVSVNNISGLGLGLYISRQIVEAHRGRIWVESGVGEGAIFWVELPKNPLFLEQKVTD